MALSESNKKLREKMLTEPAICVERALYMTESYRETEGEYNVTRRAKALNHILANMTIRIDDGELLAGNFTSKIRGGGVIPEVKGQWLLDELDTLTTRETDRYAPMLEEEIRVLRDVLPYWKGRSACDRLYAGLPEENKRLTHLVVDTAGYSENGHHWAHTEVNYNTIITVGSEGVIRDAENKIAALTYEDHKDIERNQFWQAVILVHRGLIYFAERYAKLAQELAEREENATRKAELERIAAACIKVPREPASNFFEALQSCYLVYTAVLIEGWGAGTTFGRMDQYLYPYYRNDIDRGVITDNEVRELLTNMLIKMNGAVNLQSIWIANNKGGHPIMQGVCIGGITSEGKDAVNELTYLILDAEQDVGLSSEDIMARINSKNPDHYVRRVLECAKNLGGKVKIVSDDSSIQAQLELGVPIEQARNYITTGCHNPTIPYFGRCTSASSFNSGLMVELALNNGRGRKVQEQLGPATGDPRGFKTFDDVWNALIEQTRAGLKIIMTNKHSDVRALANYPCVLLSSLYDPCMNRGIDDYSGGTEPFISFGIGVVGAPNVGDSLAAIKKVIFDDKRATMDELIDALDNDFVGYEKLHAMLSAAPKFGNDDDYVDSLVRDWLAEVINYTDTIRTLHGARFVVGCRAMTANVGLGNCVGALPDGRKAGLPLSEGGISPYQGRNTSGITATMKSVMKLDQAHMAGGTILNIRVGSGTADTEPKMKKLTSLVRTFCEHGGNLVQFNFADNRTLREAQAHPEQYKDLLVRVATYSAFFVELGKMIQDDIISRNEL